MKESRRGGDLLYWKNKATNGRPLYARFAGALGNLGESEMQTTMDIYSDLPEPSQPAFFLPLKKKKKGNDLLSFSL